jgi:hypothetical protein
VRLCSAHANVPIGRTPSLLWARTQSHAWLFSLQIANHIPYMPNLYGLCFARRMCPSTRRICPAIQTSTTCNIKVPKLSESCPKPSKESTEHCTPGLRIHLSILCLPQEGAARNIYALKRPRNIMCALQPSALQQGEMPLYRQPMMLPCPDLHPKQPFLQP